jgi:predicted NBD/HSP70 family sugar kinase
LRWGIGKGLSGRVRAGWLHFIGIKLTGDAAYGVMTTLRAEEVASERMPLTDRDPQAVCAVIAELVSRLADSGRPSFAGPTYRSR